MTSSPASELPRKLGRTTCFNMNHCQRQARPWQGSGWRGSSPPSLGLAKMLLRWSHFWTHYQPLHRRSGQGVPIAEKHPRCHHRATGRESRVALTWVRAFSEILAFSSLAVRASSLSVKAPPLSRGVAPTSPPPSLPQAPLWQG
jgi:hypothetical protein